MKTKKPKTIDVRIAYVDMRNVRFSRGTMTTRGCCRLVTDTVKDKKFLCMFSDPKQAKIPLVLGNQFFQT
jgi:hypothetical protein